MSDVSSCVLSMAHILWIYPVPAATSGLYSVHILLLMFLLWQDCSLCDSQSTIRELLWVSLALRSLPDALAWPCLNLHSAWWLSTEPLTCSRLQMLLCWLHVSNGPHSSHLRHMLLCSISFRPHTIFNRIYMYCKDIWTEAVSKEMAMLSQNL